MEFYILNQFDNLIQKLICLHFYLIIQINERIE